MRLPLVILAFALTACATGTDSATFYKAEAGYTVLLQAAANYVALPRCTDGGPKVCSEQKIVDQIRPAANSADATVQAAEDTLTANPNGDAAQLAISAAMNATQALTVIMTQYGVAVQ